jgi:predicted CoA-substrate-specific enzyme activase
MTGPLFVGIDAGSSATKCVVLGAEGGPLAHHVVASGFDYAEAAEGALGSALAAAGGSRADVVRCVTSGYGRENVRFADRHVTEITCHARGAREWYPQVRHIIDIGGQDTKIIRIDSLGRMADYRMNAKCAAGTGTFLESIAVRLGMSLGELDGLAMESSGATVLNSYCTVFAGTEVLERIKSGHPREEISMGLFRSIASRVLEMIASRDGPIAATGGVVAHCRAMVRALEDVLEADVLLPPLPQHAGAFGAALLAREAPERAADRPAGDRSSAYGGRTP